MNTVCIKRRLLLVFVIELRTAAFFDPVCFLNNYTVNGMAYFLIYV